MTRLPTAAALAILLVTAGIAGVASAEPNSTDYRTTATASTASTDVAVAEPQADDATFDRRLARRLAQFDLTDAQIRQVVTEASRLRDAGASPLVVRSSIVMNLYEFGVDAPFLYAESADDQDDSADAHRYVHRLVRSLDVAPEQARALHALAHRMLEDGATQEEVEEAIRRQVAAWDDGTDEDRIDRIVGVLADRSDLDRGQAAELERLIRGMVREGADRNEIHEAVSRLLDSYGIDRDRPADALARDRATRTAVAAAP